MAATPTTAHTTTTTPTPSASAPPTTQSPPPATVSPTTTGAPPPPTTTVPTTTTVPPTTTTTVAPPTTILATTTTVVTGPVTLHVEPRNAWGARDPIPDLLTPHSRAMKYLTVHHAGGNKGTQGIDRYQIWQNYHMDSKGWGDIAYHYMIHRNGTVYEARDTQYRGDTGTNYNPDRHFLVVVEGSFNANFPTVAQLERLPVVLAWAAQRFRMTTNLIGGHRDYANTTCPGHNLYPLIQDGTLKTQVDAILAAGGVRLT